MSTFENLTWRKSSYSGGNGDCVEVANLGENDVMFEGVRAVRDSKNPNGPVLLFTVAEWRAFLAGAKDGEFD